MFVEHCGSIVAISGTVFGGIYIWYLTKFPGTIIADLRGHEGLVWSVSLKLSDFTLSSTSDDRTVRLWDLSPVFADIGRKSGEKVENDHTTKIHYIKER